MGCDPAEIKNIQMRKFAGPETNLGVTPPPPCEYRNQKKGNNAQISGSGRDHEALSKKIF